MHALLSLKARIVAAGDAPLARCTRRSRAAPRADAAVSPRDRFEPRVDAAPTPTTSEIEDEDEDEEDADAASRRAQAARRRKPAQALDGGYQLPALTLLAAPQADRPFAPSQESIQENATALEGVLGDFGVRGEIINARPGPVVTLYELEPAPGIKSSRVIGARRRHRPLDERASRPASPSSPAATPSASSCPTTSARRSICASCSPADDFDDDAGQARRSASARPSAASRSSSISPACRIC